MAIKPYTIIEIFKSKGFDSKEAEEIVDFITESSQEKVLEAIKPLSTSAEVKEVVNKLITLETTFNNKLITLETTFNNKLITLETDVNNKLDVLETTFDNRLDALETKLEACATKEYVKDVELRLIKWLATTGVAIVGILIAAMKIMK